MSKLVGIKTYERFRSLWENNAIDEFSLNFIIDTGLLYTHGIFINGAVFGTAANGAVPLSIAGITNTLALSSHTHSNYLEKNTDIDISSYKIKSGDKDLLFYSGGSLYLGNTTSPTYISGSNLYSVRGTDTYDILDTSNFSVSNTLPTGYTYNNTAYIKYGSNSHQIDYVKRINTSLSFDYLNTYTLAGTNLLNGVQYGYITLYTDNIYTNPSWAQLRINIPEKSIQYRTSADANTWINLGQPNIPLNALNVAGIVSAPSSTTTNKVWKTDGNGNPAWRDELSYTFSNLKFLLISGTDLMTYNTQAVRTILAGSNISFTHDNGVLTIKAQDTTYEVVSKTLAGLVPQLPDEVTTTKFLRQDGSWATPTYTSDTNTWREIKINGTQKRSTDITSGDLDFINGSNTTVEWTSDNKLKINSTWTAWKGATSENNGIAGYLGAPGTENISKFLKGNGEWSDPYFAIEKLTDWAITTATTASNIAFTKVWWKIAPTSSNKVYGIGIHPSNGLLYYIYNNEGTYTATAYSANTGNSWRNIYTNGTSRVGTGTSTKAINFVQGDNVTITYLAAGTGDGQSGNAGYFNVKIAATDTWNANAVGIAGYVAAPTKADNANMTWLTDTDGVPAWRASNNHSHNYLPLDGGTMTGVLTLKGSMYDDAYGGGALNCNNSNIYGVNSIYTADTSGTANEGIHFYRDATHVDTIWAKSGVLYFAPNRELGTNGTSYKVWNENNDGSGSGLDADLLDGYQAKQLPLITTLSGTDIVSNTDLNGILEAGTYYCQSGSIAKKLSNTPYTGGNFRLWHIVNTGNDNSTSGQWSAQLLLAPNSAQMFIRSHSGSEFGEWKEFAFSSDLSSYLPLSGGTMTGELHTKHVFEIYNGNSTTRASSYLRFTRNGASGNDYAALGWNGNNVRLAVLGGTGNYESEVTILNVGYDGQLKLQAQDGTSPITTSSKTLVNNLNADLLDGLHSNEFPIMSFDGTTQLTTGDTCDLTSVGTYYTTVKATSASLTNPPFTESNFRLWHFSTGLSTYPAQLAISFREGMAMRGKNNTTWYGWKYFAFKDDNVASATKLQTSRTIWGQSFDGTADVSGTITVGAGDIILNNHKYIYSKDKDGNTCSVLQLSNKNVLYVGAGLYKYEDSETHIYGGSVLGFHVGSTATKMYIGSDGNVGIGTTSPSYKLDVAGTFYASGNSSIDGTLGVNGVTTIQNYIDIDRTDYGSLPLGTQLNVLRARSKNAETGTYGYNNIISIFGSGETGTTVNNFPVRIGSQSGATVVSAGESGKTFPSQNTDICNTENLCLEADGNIAMYTGVNNSSTNYSSKLAMFINTSCNVGIGTSSPSYKLHVNGTAGVTDLLTASNGIQLETASSGFNDKGILIGTGNTTCRIGSNNSGSLGIYAAGDIYLRPDSATSASSYGVYISESNITYNSNKIWHAGNDGSSSGLDADLLDGLESSDFLKKLYTTKKPNAVNWYRVADLTSYGFTILLSIGESYDSKSPTGSVFLMNIGYTNATITQIDRACRSPQQLDGVRIVRYANGKFYIDVHYKRSSGNNERLNITNLCNDNTTGSISLIDWTPIETLGEGEVVVDEASVSQTINADTATKLQTSHTLWGQSFAGTADISGNMTNVGTISASGNNTITKSSTDETKFIATNNNGTIELLTSTNRGVYDRTTTRWLIATNGTNSWLAAGNVGIGTTSPSYKLHVSGDVGASNFYTTSDRTKKQNISSLSEHIRKFQLKDTEKWHYGVIAQEVEEMFRDGEEGNMTVNYNSVLSYYVGCLENRVKELEEKIKVLETKNKLI